MIYQNDLINIKVETSEIPWLIIFTNENIKEFSQCNNETKTEIF
ncbi:MAG: HIT family protein, partial [Campylobacteraceae bacterium]|nr:HIT family protein [Campylobacteraceae bacterium]